MYKFILSFCLAFSVLGSEGKITKVIGDVFLNDIKIEANVNVYKEVHEGDKIKAIGDKSLFIVKLTDGIKYLVKNGEIIIKSQKEDKNLLELNFGQIFTKVTPKKEAPKSRLEIKTRSASMAVRGTEFYIEELPAKPTYLCVCHGTVEAKNVKGESILVYKNEDILISDGLLKKTKATDMMINMAQDILKDL